MSTPSTFYHRGCLTCTPPSQHEPKWISDPKASPERSRTFVLCFDGTGDSPDEDDSNVLQFVATLKDDPKEQVVYYQPGIGTSTNNVFKTPIRETVTKLTDKMFAYSLDDHIKEGYKFLMHNYQAGDQICIFGFSRGAYTARALAGMLQKIGLLPPSKFDQLKSAYAMYERDNEEGRRLSSQFKQTCIDVKVKFLGVWDTVESVGVDSKSLPFSRSNNTIKVFRHALSLDERRVMFTPSFCTGGKPKDQRTEQETDVKEVFFSGVHCDVGGGSVKNGTRHSLARITLRWMIRECFVEHTGIIFDAYMVNQVGLDIESIYVAPKPLSSTNLRLLSPEASPLPPKWVFEGEAQEELSDVLSPIYDQLEEHPYWQPMEFLHRFTKKDDDEVDGSGKSGGGQLVQNLGKGRKVPTSVMKRGLKIHRSVKARILARGADGKNVGYLPKIRCTIKDGEEPRCLERKEWLADKPEYFEWVD